MPNPKPLDSNSGQKTKAEIFLHHYLNKDSPTYLCAAKAYQETTQCKQGSSASYAYVYLDKLRRDGLVQEYMQRIGLGVEVRQVRLVEIINGTATRTETTTTETAKGTVTKTRSVTPSYHERLKAIDILNKMEGVYQEAKIKRDIEGQELKELFRKQRKELLDRTPAKNSTRKQIVDTTKDADDTTGASQRGEGEGET